MKQDKEKTNNIKQENSKEKLSPKTSMKKPKTQEQL